jgi:hypothetical protein
MKETIKEIINKINDIDQGSIKEAMNHKIKNPLFGGFIISWLFLNWDRLLIILFSKETIIEKISIIRKIPDNSILLGIDINHSHTFWFPALISLLFTLASPFISYILDLLHNNVITRTESNRFNRQAKILGAKTSLIDAEVKNDTQKETATLIIRAAHEQSKADIAASAANIVFLEKQSKTLKEQINTNTEINGRLSEEINANSEQLEDIKNRLNETVEELTERENEYGSLDKLLFKIQEKDDEISKLKAIVKDLEDPNSHKSPATSAMGKAMTPESTKAFSNASPPSSSMEKALSIANLQSSLPGKGFTDTAKFKGIDFNNALTEMTFPTVWSDALAKAAVPTVWTDAMAKAAVPTVWSDALAKAAVPTVWSDAMAKAAIPTVWSDAMAKAAIPTVWSDALAKAAVPTVWTDAMAKAAIPPVWTDAMAKAAESAGWNKSLSEAVKIANLNNTLIGNTPSYNENNTKGISPENDSNQSLPINDEISTADKLGSKNK